ncbi:MAG: hypothetical protein IPQ09_19100 [Myxococcales bacterium]|nr:hypothetical protein [Myxococcales bacterium]HQY59786.1 hypothetical protein [Polyangiaceae bacterium]
MLARPGPTRPWQTPLRPSIPRAPGARLAAPVFAALLAACGHPATEAECRLMVDRNVELQVAGMLTPPPDLEKEKQRVRAEMDGVLKGCVGRRITDRMLRCVQGAKSVKEIDQCTR